MSADSEEWAIKVRRFSRAVQRWVFRLVILPGVALVIAFLIWQHQNGEAVDQLEARIVATGAPLKPADLAAAFPAVADERNAAFPLMDLWEPSDPEFWKAFREGRDGVKQRQLEGPPKALPVLGTDLRDGNDYRIPWPETNRLAAAEYLEAHSEYLRNLRNALQRPECRFPIRLENGWLTLLPHLPEIRRDAELLLMSALQCLQNGQALAALDELFLIERLGGYLKEEPTVLSQMIRFKSYELAIKGSLALCSHSALTENQLAALMRLLEKMRLEQDAQKQIFVWERAMALSMTRYDAERMVAALRDTDDKVGMEERVGLKVALGLFKLTGVPKADHRFMLEAFERAVELSGLGYPERVTELSKLADETDKAAGEFPPKLMSRIHSSSLDRLAIRIARYDVTYRAARLAIEVEKYRLGHDGKTADELELMVPADLLNACTDPFDGNPLRLRKSEEGYIIYSIGPDLENNGGELKRNPVVNPKYDVGVRVFHSRHEGEPPQQHR